MLQAVSKAYTPALFCRLQTSLLQILERSCVDDLLEPGFLHQHGGLAAPVTGGAIQNVRFAFIQLGYFVLEAGSPKVDVLRAFKVAGSKLGGSTHVKNDGIGFLKQVSCYCRGNRLRGGLGCRRLSEEKHTKTGQQQKARHKSNVKIESERGDSMRRGPGTLATGAPGRILPERVRGD